MGFATRREKVSQGKSYFLMKNGQTGPLIGKGRPGGEQEITLKIPIHRERVYHRGTNFVRAVVSGAGGSWGGGASARGRGKTRPKANWRSTRCKSLRRITGPKWVTESVAPGTMHEGRIVHGGESD